jgi:mannose-6-phosphate isomerase
MLLEPRYVEKPWGGRRLERLFGRALPATVPVGESWELFDRPAGASRIANGPLAGKSLAELRGKRETPLLFKLLDVEERISVQVHPDIKTAHAHGTDPKSEAWVVLEADPGARIWRGFREGVTADSFREALAAGSPLDLLHSFEPSPGDVVSIPAGMVHACGGGLLFAEIQQSSETTYRLWDWGRGGKAARALQVDQALEAAVFGDPGPDRVAPRELLDDGNLRRILVVATRHFQGEHVTAAGIATFETTVGDDDHWHVLFILSGSGTIRAFDRRAVPTNFGPGATVLLPAGYDQYEIEPRDGKVVQALAFREA